MSVKSDLLSELEACRGEYVSGQSLADAFGVSRAAVWKAVKSLMAEGYQIDSVPHKGYSLAADCDLISPQAILLHLPEEFSGMDILKSGNLLSIANAAFEHGLFVFFIIRFLFRSLFK